MTWLAKHPWWTDGLRLKVGLITRTEATKRGVPHVRAGTPEQAEMDRFQSWVLWRVAGAKPPHPAALDNWKPEREYWDVLAEYEKAHPKPKPPPTPPPPPPAPPSRWKGAPWLRPHVHISWGLGNGTWTVDQLIDRLLTYGAEAVFFQIGDDCPDKDWQTHGRALVAAGQAHGIPVGAWGRADYTAWDNVKADLRSVMPLAGFLADVEGPCNDPNLPEHLRDEFADEMPLGVIATGGIDNAFPGLSPSQMAQRFGDYFDFVSQAYAKQGTPLAGPAGPMAAMENFAYWRGTDKVRGGFRKLETGHWQVPVIMPNAEGCPPLSAYVPWLQGYAPHFGVWCAELIETDPGGWPVFCQLATAE